MKFSKNLENLNEIENLFSNSISRTNPSIKTSTAKWKVLI